MRNLTRALTLAASIGVLAFASAADAAPAGVKIGVLTCRVDSGWGYVVASSRDMKCNFQPNNRGPEHYTGSINKLGADIGYTSGGTIEWAVVAPSSDIRPGALQGQYAGVTASATIGVGLGAHALVGGFDKSIALQPLSVEGNSGLNVAAGIGEMNLRKAEIMPASEERYSRYAEAEQAGPPPSEEAPPPREEPMPVHHHRIHHHHKAYCPKPQ